MAVVGCAFRRGGAVLSPGAGERAAGFRAPAAPAAPAQLRGRILGSAGQAYAGYAESDATFGLPSLQGLQSLAALLDGVTRMRVWQAAPDRWRVDVMSDIAESDQYQMGSVGYLWDSGSER
jgi:hypothetical protein